MDISVLIMGTVMALLFIIPIGLVVKASNNKKSAYLSKFNLKGQELGLQISFLEAVKDRVIGIDNISNKLLYVDYASGNLPKLIDLDKVESLKVVKNKIPGATKNGKPDSQNETIANVDLEFQFTNRKTEKLRFFDNGTDEPFELNEIVGKAEKWAGIISSNLKVKV